MRVSNPMHDPAVRARFSASLSGRPFPTTRGGRGHLTVPQLQLAAATGLATEYVIRTKPVKARFEAIPHWYAADLAEPGLQGAIEIDGISHNALAQQAKDPKKEAVLASLGWEVLRIRNEEIVGDIDGATEVVRAFLGRLPRPR